MRFMVIIKASSDSEVAGAQPSRENLEQMTKFNERLANEGRLVMAEGLTPSAEGSRVWFDGDAEPQVTDGPFAETKELVAGVWVLNGESLEDIIGVVKQIPNPDNQPGVVEIRPLDS